MAVVLVEGFDHLSASLITTKAWTSTGTALVAGRYTAPSGSATSQALQLNGSPTINTSKTLPSTYTTLFAGFAINYASATSRGVVAPNWLGAYNLVTGAGVLIAAVSCNASGFLQITDVGGTVAATGSTNININTWYYVELELVINGASGSVTVHLDGATEIATTTYNFGSTAIGRVTLSQPAGSTGGLSYDDFYCADTTGSPPQNTFLGPARVITPMPNGVGTHSQWTPNGTTPNFACVDEFPPDGDTTFVSSSTVGQLDSYLCGQVPLGATIFAVQTNLYSRKDDANTRQIAPLIRQAGTDYVGNTATEQASYVDHTQIYNQDPTGTNWTVAVFNADEFGVKEIA